MSRVCPKCKKNVEDYEKFCPWCGYEVNENDDADFSIPATARDTKSGGAKTAINRKVGSFKVSRYRDAAIGITAVILLAAFIVFAIVKYVSGNTYQTSVTAYLNILNGNGTYRDLVEAVGEDLCRDAAADYYDLGMGDLKKGAERLNSISAAAKTPQDYEVTVKIVKELDSIDLLAYQRSQKDKYGSGFDIKAQSGYEVEAVKKFSDPDREKERQKFIVVLVGNEWCTYDALPILADAADYAKMSDDDFSKELKAYNGAK